MTKNIDKFSCAPRFSLWFALLISISLCVVVLAVAQEVMTKKSAEKITSDLRNELGVIPKLITQSKLDDNTFRYVIGGDENFPVKDNSIRDPNHFVQTGLDSIPNETRLNSYKVDYQSGSVILNSSEKLDRSGLSEILDGLSKLRSDVPCWDELVSRDFPISEDYNADQYHSEAYSDETPKSIAWFWLSRNKSISMPFVIRKNSGLGTLHIVPYPVTIGDHYRYHVRVLDGDGSVIWSDSKSVYGVVRVSICDRDSDDLHEILFECHAGGESKLIYMKPSPYKGTQ